MNIIRVERKIKSWYFSNRREIVENFIAAIMCVFIFMLGLVFLELL